MVVVPGEDPALGDLPGKILEERGQGFRGHPFGCAVVDIDLPVAHAQGVDRPGILEGEVDLEGDVAQPAWQRLPHVARHVLRPHHRPHRDLGVVQDLLVDHAPLALPVQDLAPLRPEGSPLGILGMRPAADFLEERPLGEVEVAVEVQVEIPREDDPHRRLEDLLQVEVDGARRPVVVDVRVHVIARVEEHDEGLRPSPVEGEPLGRDEAVVEDALEIGVDGDAAHVRVPEDVVEVVGGVDAREDGLEDGEPPGVAGRGLRVALAHEVADPARVERFPVREGRARAAPEPPDHVPERFPDDALPHQLVAQVVVGEEVVVEEVAEGPVTHVVQEAGHAQELLDERRGRSVREDGAERGPELLGEASGHVHRAERMRKPAVLGGREDPARGLELGDAPEALDPRGVDQVFLGRLPGDPVRPRVDEIAVDGVDDEAFAAVRIGPGHGGPTGARPGCGHRA